MRDERRACERGSAGCDRYAFPRAILNGGDDGFFQHAQGSNWYSGFVQAQYGNAVFQAAGSGTYNIFVSQTGLYAVKANT